MNMKGKNKLVKYKRQHKIIRFTKRWFKKIYTSIAQWF